MSNLKYVPQVPDFSVPITRSPTVRDPAARQEQIERVARLMRTKDAVLIAHYYTDPEIQELADYTQGFIGDSLAMAEFGLCAQQMRLIVAGVKFMGETAKILSPDKTVLMPTLKATCSLDLGCPVDEFAKFCDAHPDRTVVVYANTSAAVKARADWVVTSANALDIVNHLDAEGKKIIWAPDRYLGSYVQKQTGADMLLWQGSCIVHEEYQAESLKELMQAYPDAAVLVHPESPAAIIELAHVVGSTSRLLKASQELPHETFIVATDRGIFYKMRQASPHKTFIEAPTAGRGASCHSCGHCPWMAMNTLDQLEQALLQESGEIVLDADIIKRAQVSLARMLDFSRQQAA